MLTQTPGLRSPHPSRLRQRGVSLLFALCALVVLTMGGVAMLRSADTGLLTLGNLGFKRDTLVASSVGTNTAISWISANGAGALLQTDVPALGYFSTARAALDPTGSTIATNAPSLTLVDWNGNGCAEPGVGGRIVPANCLKPNPNVLNVNGNTVSYVITRLCAATGPVVGNDCVKPVGRNTVSSVNKGYFDYGTVATPGQIVPATFYRIITRTVGVRGTVSYTETLVHY